MAVQPAAAAGTNTATCSRQQGFEGEHMEQEFFTASDVGKVARPPLTPAAIRAAADSGRLPVAART